MSNLKKSLISITILSIAVIVSIVLQKNEIENNQFENKIATVPLTIDDSHFIPGYGNSFVGFKERIGFRESRGKYHVVNELGYMGKYQFGNSTLESLKIKDSAQFLNSSKIQEKVFSASIAKNKWYLKKELELFVGKKINGVVITESGILAAAHLAGVGSVKKYLYSNGRKKAKDAFGTQIQDYIKEFSNYDLSIIQPDKNPKY